MPRTVGSATNIPMLNSGPELRASSFLFWGGDLQNRGCPFGFPLKTKRIATLKKTSHHWFLQPIFHGVGLWLDTFWAALRPSSQIRPKECQKANISRRPLQALGLVLGFLGPSLLRPFEALSGYEPFGKVWGHKGSFVRVLYQTTPMQKNPSKSVKVQRSSPIIKQRSPGVQFELLAR